MAEIHVPETNRLFAVEEAASCLRHDTQEWLTAKELAAWLGYSVNTIYGWRYRRQGPPGHRPGGGSLRFREADVERWLESCRDAPSEEQT